MSKFKVGDRVRVLADNGSDLEIGSEHFVTSVLLANTYEVDDYAFCESDLELVSDTKSEFKVGDRVRILDRNYSRLEVGSEHTVNEILDGVIRVREWFFDDVHLELVESKSKFKVGHGAICIKKTHEHNVGDVLLVSGVLSGGLRFEDASPYFLEENFTPFPNPPRPHYKEMIAYALGADIEVKLPSGSWGEITRPSFLDSGKYRVAIPDPNAEKREKLQSEIARLQSELDNLGGDL